MAKILIVDDDPDMVETSKIVLEARGYETDSASNGKEAMSKVDEFAPDVILMDVMMEEPDDGIATSQDLRRKGIQTPIILLSGISQLTGMQYDKNDETTPVDAFLEKPISPETLLSTIEEVLNK